MERRFTRLMMTDWGFSGEKRCSRNKGTGRWRGVHEARMMKSQEHGTSAVKFLSLSLSTHE